MGNGSTMTFADVQEFTKPTPLWVKFYARKVIDTEKTKENGYPTHKNKTYAQIHMDGDNTIWDGPADLSSELLADKQHPDRVKRCHDIKYPEEYKRFLSGNSDDVIGFRLSAFFVNDPAKADFYEHFHIFTVEQLAAVTETTLIQLGLGARADKDLCIAYLKQASSNANYLKSSSEVNNLKEQVDFYKEETQNLKAQIAKLESLVIGDKIATEEIKTERKRRGMPKGGWPKKDALSDSNINEGTER